ncbi:MAG TPA: hypothetical protein VFM35_01590, partial [Candidatus Binatia bacterium]|nr:hypothetical protein [Candidatus Binatia bacterium]
TAAIRTRRTRLLREAGLAACECDLEAMSSLCLSKRLPRNSGLWKCVGQLMSRRSAPAAG